MCSAEPGWLYTDTNSKSWSITDYAIGIIAAADKGLTIPVLISGDTHHYSRYVAEDGTQFNGAKQVQLQLSEPERGIGPLDVDLRKAGPGHYTASGATFAAPGEWTATVTVRTSKFDETEARIEVPIK